MAGGTWRNIPNALTLGRLVLAFIACACVSVGWFGAALILFAVAALTDALDGYLARALGQTTALGRQLDPLVDKVMIICVMAHLLPVAGSGVAPWMVTAIVTRELGVQALRSLVEGRGVAFGARWSGKVKTACQCAGVLLTLVGLMYPSVTALLTARDITLWVAVGLTVCSGLEYVIAGLAATRTT